MNASELRIGNIVRTCTPGMAIMIPILDAEVQAITIYGYVEFRPGFEGFKMSAKHITGIPLTEEWLLKFGFIGNDIEYRYNDFRLLLNEYGYFNLWTNTVSIGDESHSESISMELKYIHQLQNLYFALTGEELQITQTPQP